VAEHACAATTKRGTACRSIVPAGRAYCLAHDPERRDEVAAARSNGARKANSLRALNGRRRRLDNHAGLAAFITNVVYDVIDGRADPDVARAALYGCSILRQLAEHGLEKRLAEVERLLAQRRPA
jgi:hypothetical protein